MIVIGYLIQYIWVSILQILNKKKYQKIPIIIGIIFSILLLSFNKGEVVGTDYRMYNNFFDFYLKEDLFPKFYIKDSGWGLMAYFYSFGKIFKDFKYIVLFIILFHNFIVYYFFRKYCYKKLFYFSFLTYFSFFYINNTFNPMKQIIAICIFSLAFKYIIKNNIFKYTFFIGIASLFHVLVVITLVFYYWLNNKINVKKIILLFFMSLGIILLLKNNVMLIGSLFSDNLRYYQYFLGAFNQVEFNILNFFEIYIPFIFIVILDYKYNLRKITQKNKIFINLYYGYSFLYLTTILDKMMGARFVLFFSLGFSVIYPYIFYLIFKKYKMEKLYYIFYPLWMLIFLYFRHLRILI